jgi:hypothetical protein
MRRANVVVLVAVTVFFGALPAHGTSEGANGRIAFERHGVVFTVNPNGSDPTALTTGYAPRWSPDGLRIAFFDVRDGVDFPRVYVMNADGSDPNLLASIEGREPRWSPRGDELVFLAGEDRRTLARVAVPLGEPRMNSPTVSAGSLPTSDLGFWLDRNWGAWSPQEPLFAFTLWQSVGQFYDRYPSVYVLEWPWGESTSTLDLATAELVTSGATSDESPCGSYGELGSWSPDGLSISYTFLEWACTTRIVDPAHHTWLGVEVPPGTFPTGIDPTWSPDGSMLVFQRNIYDPGLYSVNPSGTDALRITTNGSDARPSWQAVAPVPLAHVDTSTGVWMLRDGSGYVHDFYFGNPGDIPVMGDWTCDGTTTPGLFRQSDGYAYLRDTNTQGTADRSFHFGNPGDVPLAGDWNGDGCDTLSIYRPATQEFHIINHLGTADTGLGAADHSFTFGNPGDTPVVGDWDGDGIDEIGLYRESTGFFYYRNTLTTGVADGEFYYGDPSDRFIAGDWTGNGMETPAVFRPTMNRFYFKNTLGPGPADHTFTWGNPTWTPLTGTFELP